MKKIEKFEPKHFAMSTDEKSILALLKIDEHTDVLNTLTAPKPSQEEIKLLGLQRNQVLFNPTAKQQAQEESNLKSHMCGIDCSLQNGCPRFIQENSKQNASAIPRELFKIDAEIRADERNKITIEVMKNFPKIRVWTEGVEESAYDFRKRAVEYVTAIINSKK